MNFSKIIEEQFNKILANEGQEIIDYYTEESYNVFFRTKSSKNNVQDSLYLFYPQSTNISKGTIFNYKNDSYLVITQDATESDIYFSSVAYKCTETFSTEYNGTKYYVPVVVDNSVYDSSENDIITVVDGNVNCYTGLSDISKNIQLNDDFKKFGGQYVVKNKFYNDCMAHIYLEQTAITADAYVVTYNGDAAISMDDSTTYQLSFSATKNDEVDSTATITYTSSDETIATVDTNGLMTMLQAGTVDITATWTEQSVSTTVSIVIAQTVEEATYSMLTTNDSQGYLMVDDTRYVYATPYNSDGTENTSVTLNWTITKPSGYESEINCVITGNQCKVTIDEDYDLIDEVVTFEVSDSDGGYIGSKEFTISA